MNLIFSNMELLKAIYDKFGETFFGGEVVTDRSKGDYAQNRMTGAIPELVEQEDVAGNKNKEPGH